MVEADGKRYNPFCDVYSTKAEYALSQPDVCLGAIIDLPPTDNPSLIDMLQAYGANLAAQWMLPHIAALNAASGASNRMDEAALALCCMDIITNFPYLTCGELCVFCVRMRGLRYVRRRGEYAFSSDTIMRGLHEFLADRTQELNRYERIKQEREQQPKGMYYSEYIELCRKEGRQVDGVSPLDRNICKSVK